MAVLTKYGVVRDILLADITLTADEVIAKAKARGLKGADSNLRYTVHNVRSELKKAKVAPSAARTTQPEPAAPVIIVTNDPVPVPATAPASDLAAVLANVAQVNTVVVATGGVDVARQVAEAVRACGGPDTFLQVLDLVANIRGNG